MDYKEKYEQALAKAKEILEYYRRPEYDEILAYAEADLAGIFPELHESEDERIIKAIKSAVLQLTDIYLQEKYGLKQSDCIAWLEKQGDANKEYWRGYREGKKEILDKYSELEKQGEQLSISEEEIEIIKKKAFKEGRRAGIAEAHAEMAKHQEEKKNEQKPVDKVEPKFKVGDWVVWQNKCYKINYNDCGYELIDQNGLSTSLEYGTVDESAHLWNITKDAKYGDILFQDLMDGKIFIFDGINPEMAILYSFIINNDGTDVLLYHIGKPNTGIGYIEENKNIIHPATKEQHDLLFQKMHEAGYEWDAKKKELKKIEQKPAWSEEDEKMLNQVIEDIVKLAGPYVCYHKDVEWLKSIKDRVLPQQKEWSEEDEKILKDIILCGERHLYLDARSVVWLKALRPQSHWKPSDEQMEELGNCIHKAWFNKDTLVTLYNELMKL